MAHALAPWPLLLAATLLPACGNATARDDAATPLEAPPSCPRVEDAAPAPVVTTPRSGSAMASEGCSFAATWIADWGGGPAIVATTFHVVEGAWRPSDVVELAPAGPHTNAPAIAWDGSAYVIAWADEVLFLQRLSPVGTLIGSAVPSVATSGDAHVDWLMPSGDGSLRVAFRSHPGIGAFFARVMPDGAAVLPPTRVAQLGPVEPFGFTHAAGVTTLVGTVLYNEPGHTSLFDARFDDDGNALAPPTLRLTGNLDAARGGAALADGETLFGVLDRERDAPAVVGWLPPIPSTEPGEDALMASVPGQDAPVLATVGSRSVGVLSRTVGNERSDLQLSIVEDGVVAATTVIPAQAEPHTYAMAGGDSALGILWEEDTGLVFTSRSP